MLSTLPSVKQLAILRPDIADSVTERTEQEQADVARRYFLDQAGWAEYWANVPPGDRRVG